MLAVACSRNLVTPARRRPQRSHHEWHIPQLNQSLARSRDLVTHAARGADRGHTRGGRRARPARERRARGPGSTRRCLGGSAKGLDWRPCWRADMRWPSSTVDAYGCDGRGRKTARNTSTCAVQTAPSPLPDWVEQDGPIGHAPRQKAESEEDGHQPRRRPVKDVNQKKIEPEEEARSNRLTKGRFGSALTRLFGAERKHDEWWHVERRLDGWVRRHMGADLACHRGRRPRCVGRPAQGQVIVGGVSNEDGCAGGHRQCDSLLAGDPFEQ